MTNYRRRYGVGRRFFFTVLTHERRSILTSEMARECLRQAWEAERKARPFEVVALVLLPNHIHCIWKMPKEDDDYSLRWGRIKSSFTRLYKQQGGWGPDSNESRKKRKESGFWQRRFWEHRIRDEEDLQNHVDYIHFNPVRHGYVESPDQWPWSTIRKYGDREYVRRLVNGDVSQTLCIPGEFE